MFFHPKIRMIGKITKSKFKTNNYTNENFSYRSRHNG
jgi:hypothetical protein